MAKALDDLFEELTPRARRLAAAVGCVLDNKKPVLMECVDGLLPVEADLEIAAKDLSIRIAVTHAQEYGIRRLVELNGNGSVKGLLGFAEDGTPRLCVARGIVSVELPDGREAYLGLAALYGLRTNGSSVPHKPSDS